MIADKAGRSGNKDTHLLLRKREIVVFADTPFHFLPPSCPHCTAFYGFAELEINSRILSLITSTFSLLPDLSMDRFTMRRIVSLAKKNNIDFVTGDKRLYNGVKDKLGCPGTSVVAASTISLNRSSFKRIPTTDSPSTTGSQSIL